ncbi:DUF4376 domain-containing protein [Pseudomonas nitroreducens]|uniref:DUF4376 domain-containing protein n=1 Tax=Pseudomonas nitroreducens TaxID=46680 RepID=UPI0023FA2FB4|nr:DUF4376 domain-containing protein [Pseudomonas nitroreducens]WEW99795.1 DUF4376 domain-containing protein [Pseudomonas nitroreducens]
MYFYSAQTEGWYRTDIHGDEIPGDAVAISDEGYSELCAGVSASKMLIPGEDGRPMLVDRPGPDLKSLISTRRYLAETAGIIVNGMPLDTGRDSQALVTGAALQALIDSTYTCQWKTSEGFVELDAVHIIAMSSAVRAHVQECFDREAELLVHLEAGTFVDSMLEEGWPA